MTLYQLDRWEHNGPWDSDWYAVVYDDSNDTIRRIETGTTRFANALDDGSSLPVPTPEIWALVDAAWERQTIPVLVEAERILVHLPYESLVPGTPVAINKDCKIGARSQHTCEKCGGDGKWKNPRNPEDQRTCFACQGRGIHLSHAIRGKWVKLSAGMKATVLESPQAFGTFYRNGYNKPCRENSRVMVKLADGTIQWIGADKLRLDRDERTIPELVKVWRAHGGHLDFYTPFKTAGIRL